MRSVGTFALRIGSQKEQEYHKDIIYSSLQYTAQLGEMHKNGTYLKTIGRDGKARKFKPAKSRKHEVMLAPP
jgi:hypothetical protein